MKRGGEGGMTNFENRELYTLDTIKLSLLSV